MNKKKSVLVTALALSMGVAGTASAATVYGIRITGGAFSNGAPASLSACAGTAFSSHQCITAGNSNPIDTFDGQFEGPTLTNFNFFNAPVTTFTAASALGAANSTSGLPIEGTVDTTAGTISLNLGSFYAQWSGTNFLQSPSSYAIGALDPIVTGTYTATGPTTGTFDISWTSYVTTAPFAGSTIFWELTGIASTAPVPSPASAWLLASGLLGLIVMLRRKAA